MARSSANINTLPLLRDKIFINRQSLRFRNLTSPHPSDFGRKPCSHRLFMLHDRTRPMARDAVLPGVRWRNDISPWRTPVVQNLDSCFAAARRTSSVIHQNLGGCDFLMAVLLPEFADLILRDRKLPNSRLCEQVARCFPRERQLRRDIPTYPAPELHGFFFRSQFAISN